MSAQNSPSDLEPGTGSYALQCAVIYAFGAFAVLALVALLLQWLTSYVGLVMAENLTQLSSGFTMDSRACLIGFLTLGAVHWNISGMGAMRRARRAKRAARTAQAVPRPPRPVPFPRQLPTRPWAPLYRERPLERNPYLPETWAK